LSDQPKDSIPRESDTRPDSAAVKVLDRYLFKFNRLEQKESDFVVKRMLRNLIALCERLADADRDCRKEWQSDGKMLTREFIVGVLLPNAFVAIREHERTFQRGERPRWLDIRDWIHLGNRFDAEIRLLRDDLEKAYKGEADEPAKQSQARPSVAMKTKLRDRELKIWKVIQRGAKSREYCRELDSAGIAPQRSGIWKDCPRKYESAYLQGEPWRHRIQDEKSKVRHKAELAGLAKLASE
jgi:hypothetical protein